jgi:hypothetical protein
VTLADLRKLAVRRQTRIRFALEGGLECVVNEHGVARVPGLKRAPDFNLERELAAAQRFHFDELTGDPKKPVHTRDLRREEVSALTGASATAEVHDHDDE